MAFVFAAMIGALTAAAVYLMLSRDLVRYLFALIMISNAINLLVFGSGGLTFAAAPIVPERGALMHGEAANALPQALVLTAIVIGFGLLVFALALVWRGYRELGTIDSDALDLAEPSIFARPARPGGTVADTARAEGPSP